LEYSAIELAREISEGRGLAEHFIFYIRRLTGWLPGSAELDRLREFIFSRLRELGYQVSVRCLERRRRLSSALCEEIWSYRAEKMR